MNRVTPTIYGWFLRDVTIAALLIILMYLTHLSYFYLPGITTAFAGAAIGFIACYILCYISHEWGHLIGARLTDANMPLNGYRNILIGQFDISQHSRQQFLALSWGGVIAYVCIMIMALSVYLIFELGWVGAGFAVGGVAFVSQSLAVDVPQIIRVARGADILVTHQYGASAQIILRRTWQTWLPLATLVAVAQVF